MDLLDKNEINVKLYCSKWDRKDTSIDSNWNKENGKGKVALLLVKITVPTSMVIRNVLFLVADVSNKAKLGYGN